MRRRRYAVLLSFASLAVLTYFDRLAISVAGPRMQSELGFTPEQWGWIVGIFALTYGALEIPTGALGDRYGQRRVITRIVLWWSAFTALTGMVNGFLPLLLVRLLFGAGEAGAFPNIAGGVSRWFPASQRARAQGAVWSASRCGGTIAPLLVVPFMKQFGWRAMFWLLGAAGVIWAVWWFRWYRNTPAEDPRVTAEERREVAASSEHVREAKVPWAMLFRSPLLWRMMLMYWCYGWGAYFYLSWLHTYLVKGKGLTEAEMGLFSTLPFVLGAFANLAGGWLSDRLALQLGLRNGRRLLGSVALMAAACCVLATALTTDKLLGVVLISAGYGCMDLMLPSAWATALDVGGPYAGAVSGAMNSCGQLGGFLCSVLFGYLVATYQTYNAPLLVITVMLVAAAGLFLGLDASRPLVTTEAQVQRA